MSSPAPIPELRAAFPALDEGLCFFDWGSTGLLPEGSRRALASFADEMATCPTGQAGWIHARHAATRHRVRELAAEMLGASPAEIALVENTTTGLNAASESIPLREGDGVILSALDYPAVAQPWKQRRLRDEIALHFVPAPDGRIEAGRILESIDDRTRVVSVSSQAWTTGALSDLAAIGRETRMRGILFVVDGVQSFGVVPLDVKALGIDFLAVGGHKWLNAPFGAGFLFVDQARVARHQPQRVGFLSGRPPRESWLDWFQDPGASPEEELLMPASAQAFESGGTPSYPGAVALEESLKLLRDAGGERILAHVRALGDHLIAGLDRLGLELATPRDPSLRGGVVSFHHPDGAAAEIVLAERLSERRVVLSVRYSAGHGGLRCCLHGMNGADDVDRLLEVLSEELPRG